MSEHADLYPEVRAFGDLKMESFDSYYARWPPALASIPKPVVQDWIYRHWRCFSTRWMDLEPHRWTFELVEFANAENLAIDHVGNWIAELDAEGIEFVNDFPRARGRVGRYMLAHGTFPLPIIVAESAGHIVLPGSRGEHMKSPLQLIEGHTRLACLRGMIHAQTQVLQSRHSVWRVTIPQDLARLV